MRKNNSQNSYRQELRERILATATALSFKKSWFLF